ncbi:MAG: hypothetical protein AAF721_39085 [Myxococcota bacterium]
MTVSARQLPIVSPCPTGLGPENAGGWCGHCQQEVHDLSAMTEPAARKLLSRREPICVAYRARADGTVVFRRSAAPPRWSMVALMAAVLGCSQAGCAAIYEATHAQAPPPTAVQLRESCPVRPPAPEAPTPRCSEAGKTATVNFTLDPEAHFFRGAIGRVTVSESLLDRHAERLEYTPTKELVADTRRRWRRRFGR